MQLDCFDVLGETGFKTEGHLQARIERAVACVPCLLLLRNLEALTRKSQALETGQGAFCRSRRPVLMRRMTQNWPCGRSCASAFEVTRQGWRALCCGVPMLCEYEGSHLLQIPWWFSWRVAVGVRGCGCWLHSGPNRSSSVT